jgi:hypothetical protein
MRVRMLGPRATGAIRHSALLARLGMTIVVGLLKVDAHEPAESSRWLLASDQVITG